MKKVALYARISTRDGRQHADNQIDQLRGYCERYGWSVVATFIDEDSGAKGRKERTQLDEMMVQAYQRKFDMLLVFALDRLTREGVFKAFEYIETLKGWGVEFRSITEPQFTTSGAAGDLFLAVAAWMAKQERARMIERIQAGMDRAKARGVKFGRKPSQFDLKAARELEESGWSRRGIAKSLNVPLATVSRKMGKKATACPIP